MEHTVVIWSKSKEPNELGDHTYFIRTRMKVTEKEIEEMVLREYLDGNTRVREDETYFAELESTTHN